MFEGLHSRWSSPVWEYQNFVMKKVLDREVEYVYFLGIEGENLNGVYTANEYLTRVNLMKDINFSE
jgi:hypothetical protein